MRKPLIFVVVLAVVVLTPISALAAMDATLSSTHARPGDFVLLLTDDHKGTWHYDGLSAESNQAIYLAATTSDAAQACTGPGSQTVGRLQWRGNAAGLTFQVPSLPPADYWLFMETHAQCWRVAGQTGGLHSPLILTIGTVPADNEDVAKRWTVDSLPVPKRSVPQPSPVPQASPWLPIAGGVLGFLALLVLAVGLNRLRRSSRT